MKTIQFVIFSLLVQYSAFGQIDNKAVLNNYAQVFQKNLKKGLDPDFVKKKLADPKCKPCDTLAILSVAQAQGALARAEVSSQLDFSSKLTSDQILQSLYKGYRKNVEGLRADYLELIKAELNK